MINETSERAKKRNKHRSNCISDNLIDEIENITKGYNSVSSFIRLAVVKEIERVKNENRK